MKTEQIKFYISEKAKSWVCFPFDFISQAFVSGVGSFHSLTYIQNITYNCNTRKINQNQISLGYTAKWRQAGFYYPL